MLTKAFFIETHMSTYFQKLRDPRWQKKRLEVMQINEFHCEICGDGESPLNVHHKAYFKNKEPWEYLNQQLSCLCESCHDQEHKNIDPFKFFGSLLNLDGPGSKDAVSLVLAGIVNFDYFLALEILNIEDSIYFKKRYEIGQKLKDSL